MKRFIFKYILRAKFFVGYSRKRHWLRKYFWKLETAGKFAEKQTSRTIIWSVDYKKILTTEPFSIPSIHEDAKNFSTNI